MGKPTGFMEYDREVSAAAAPLERIKHFEEIGRASCRERVSA